MKLRRLFRVQARRHKQSPEGKNAFSFGLRIGYWPCLKAPFVQVSFAFWIVDMWHGRPSKEMLAER